MTKSLALAYLIGGILVAFCKADSPLVNGDWNYTYTPQAPDSMLCIRMKAGIRLDVQYDSNNGSKIATFNSTARTFVNSDQSVCLNLTTAAYDDEILALNFDGTSNQTLLFTFTRDPKITKDDSKNRWTLSKVEFDFVYDPNSFPDSNVTGKDFLTNNQTLTGISTVKDHSFACSRTGAVKVSDRLNITLTNLRVQAYMSGDDFSAADHCAVDQETTDLIPIIIGAALAALVIIVLIAYLIGRARANTPAYDNMK